MSTDGAVDEPAQDTVKTDEPTNSRKLRPTHSSHFGDADFGDHEPSRTEDWRDVDDDNFGDI